MQPERKETGMRFSRRDLMHWAPAGASAALLARNAAGQASAGNRSRPNILLIISDQFRITSAHWDSIP